jgi:predicted DNA-binding antitoxin AbrB/MazE fold protein
MPKAIRGIYENGKIKLPLKELPGVKGEIQVIVVFLEVDTSTQQAGEGMMTEINVTPSVVSEGESLKDEKNFSIADSSFFSLPPEHLGRTSANELDKIIAKEALGRK